MQDPNSDPFLSVTKRLSELVASEEGTLILAHLQRLRMLFPLPRSRQRTPSPSAPSQRGIGIWQAQCEDDGTISYVRHVKRRQEWRCWADIERIPPRTSKKRIVLVGESVARGYLYDPLITPAMILERMLNESLSAQAVEVIDLARIDLTGDELVRLIASSLTLEPDCLVVFAGNNWNNVPLSSADFWTLAEALREGGFPRLRNVFLERILVPRSQATMDMLGSISRAHDLPVAIIVPEFNLLEWRNEPSMLVPLLEDDHNCSWMDHLRCAEGALSHGRFGELARHAAAMVALDDGTSAVSQTYLGLTALHRGNLKEARHAFEAARDAPCGLLLPHSPRCPGAIQDVLRTKAQEHGLALVDLPRLFAAEQDGELPDHRLFLDYCHLSLQGMKIAMAEVATCLMPILGTPPSSAQELRETSFNLSREDEAVVHFLVAIHNAHYGQGEHMFHYHCQEAVRASPGVARQMLWFLDFRTRRAQHWMCESYDLACRSPAIQRYLAATDPRMIDKLADYSLVEVILAALKTVDIEAAERIDAVLLSEHGWDNDVDLLSYPYRAATFRERQGYSLGPERAYCRAYTTVSRFYLIRARSDPVELALTCRLVGRVPTEGDVVVAVNGTVVCRLVASDRWRTYCFGVSSAVLCAGINRIEVTWPCLPRTTAEELERAARSLERGVPPEVLPVLAEIDTFTCTAQVNRSRDGAMTMVRSLAPAMEPGGHHCAPR